MMLPFLSKISTFAAFNTGPCDPNQVVQHPFFGFPHWWEYVHKGNFDGLGHCTPNVEFPAGVWPIVLAVTDMLLYLAGLVAVVSIIVAGVSYMLSMGNVEKAVSARKRIVNSLIGLVIVLTASGLVAFIGNRLGA